jgi:hypothetical protein
MMYSRPRGVGQSLQAVAGPTMPANVAAANTAVTLQPYYNIILQLGQNPPGTQTNATTGITSSASSVLPPGWATLSGSQQQAMLAPYLSTWQYLPTYLANAPIVDAWDQQNNFGVANYTQMGQTAQTALQQIFSAMGISPPALAGSTTSSGATSTIFGIPLTYAIGGLVIGALFLGGD